MGSSCRAVIAGMLTGLDSLVAYIRGRPDESDFYIHGYERCQGDVRRFFAVGALTSWMSDAVLEILLEDDMLPVVEQQIDEEIESEED